MSVVGAMFGWLVAQRYALANPFVGNGRSEHMAMLLDEPALPVHLLSSRHVHLDEAGPLLHTLHLEVEPDTSL